MIAGAPGNKDKTVWTGFLHIFCGVMGIISLALAKNPSFQAAFDPQNGRPPVIPDGFAQRRMILGRFSACTRQCPLGLQWLGDGY